MNTIKLKKDRSLIIIIGLLDAILWVSVFAMMILASSDGYLTAVLLLAVFAVLLTAATRSIARWKLLFDEEGVTYTPMMGRTKKLAYREILRVTIGQGYIIYDRNGGKWAVFADDSPGALKAINLMKAAGIKMDLY